MANNPNFFTDGQAYERQTGRWSRVVGERFIQWLALPSGLAWLDVGCGTGAFTELIIERSAPKQVNGIDPAEDQIAYAKTRPVARNAALRVGSALALPYVNKEFDVAAMALVITFIPTPGKAVSEMSRVVKPGGTVATYIWDFFGRGFPQHPLVEALKAMNAEPPRLPTIENSRSEALTGFFKQAELDQITTTSIEITVSYANFDDYWSAQTALENPVVQSVRKMSGSDVERLKAYLREHLPKDGNGRIAYSARANAVKGLVPQ